MSFESNRVDWVRSLQKIRLQDCLFQIWLERPSRASFAPLFRQNQNFENATNMSFRSNGVDWVRLLRKIQRQDFVFQKSLERPSQTYVATFYGRKPKLRKRNKHKFWVKRGELGAFIATNMSFGSNEMDWVRSLRKFQLQDFLFQKWLERPSRANFTTLYHRKPRL